MLLFAFLSHCVPLRLCLYQPYSTIKKPSKAKRPHVWQLIALLKDAFRASNGKARQGIKALSLSFLSPCMPLRLCVYHPNSTKKKPSKAKRPHVRQLIALLNACLIA